MKPVLRSKRLLKVVDLQSCVLCSSNKFAPFSSGYDYELNTCSNEWRFLQCLSCHHVQLSPRPKVEDLNIIYPTNYYSYTLSKKLNFFIYHGKAFIDSIKLRNITKHLDVPIHSYLDIGCGDGRYLRQIEKLYKTPRVNIYGIELNSTVVDGLKGDGFSVFCDTFDSCNNIPHNSLNLITMFHVIEHISNPNESIKKAYTLLAPGGLIAIETPNFNSSDAKIFKNKYWGGYHFPRHWHLFDEATLSKLLVDNKIIPINISYQTGHSFWLYSFHHAIKYSLNMPRLAKIFDPMSSVTLLIIFTFFDKIRAFLGFRTSSILIIGKKY